MPCYRGITVSCQSQYDCCTIVEEPLPGASLRNTSSLLNADTASTPCFRVNEDFVHLQDPEVHVAEVEIPAYPGSQFWLSYACPPPAGGNFRFWYFKLFVGGQCLVSWGIGEEDDYSGKTMFALYDGGTDFEGRRLVAKSGFFFPNEDEIEHGGRGSFEIRVFRCQARRRERVLYEKHHEPAGARRHMSLASIGRLHKGDARRQYAYALLDPVDSPYATFRYHLQRRSETTSVTTSLASTEAQSPHQEAIDDQSPEDVAMRSLPPVRRMSVPPSDNLKLHPAKRAAKPASPGDNTIAWDSGGLHALPDQPDSHGHGEGVSSHDWAMQTASPVKPDPVRPRRAATPPSGLANDGSVSLLRGVIASALKRRDPSGGNDNLVYVT